MAVVAYSDKLLKWQLGRGHPTNPVRARNAVEKLKGEAGIEVWEDWAEVEGSVDHWAELACSVHDPAYVERVRSGLCGDWRGVQPELGETALVMFGGTVSLVERMLGGEEDRVFFNPQGAKHHAAYDRSSGFCVFNDMAWAAVRLSEAGKRVVYIDWDAHHGDGVEDLLRGREDLVTFSLHEWGIFPGTGAEDGPGYYNYPMSEGASDLEMLDAVDDIVDKVRKLKPDVILLACGADGLERDPLSSLRFTHRGLREASREIAALALGLDAQVLIGGAGGYRPHDDTPQHWAECVQTIVDILE